MPQNTSLTTLPKLDPSLFDWQTWRAGSLADLGFFSRRWSIKESAGLLRRHAVGYCEASQLQCRPKLGCMAVMFDNDGRRFWTHLTLEEFDLLNDKGGRIYG